MAKIDTAMAAIHLLFAGLWAGGVVFVTAGVLPTADRGSLEPIVDRLTTLSRASAAVLLVTGGHLAGSRYTADSLLGSTGGYLVVAMVVLWVALAALVEVGSKRLADDAASGVRLYQAASVVGVVLLLIGGVLAA